MTPELAETLAVQALTWLIGEDDLRDVFFHYVPLRSRLPGDVPGIRLRTHMLSLAALALLSPYARLAARLRQPALRRRRRE